MNKIRKSNDPNVTHKIERTERNHTRSPGHHVTYIDLTDKIRNTGEQNAQRTNKKQNDKKTKKVKKAGRKRRTRLGN